LSHLECPLAVAPRGMQDDPGARLERIGVGFDATPESEAALSLAGSIALAADADLRVRGVVDDQVARATRTEGILLGGDGSGPDGLGCAADLLGERPRCRR
jgi:hypothetical protein